MVRAVGRNTPRLCSNIQIEANFAVVVAKEQHFALIDDLVRNSGLFLRSPKNKIIAEKHNKINGRASIRWITNPIQGKKDQTEKNLMR